jgi:Arc/MetJ-type ribon-helix-helix transcriptional regulator
MARMNVIFEDALLDEMRELVPSRQRSGFIEEAVRARLAQLRQIQAAEAAAGAWSGEGRGEPSQEIDEGRRAWEARRRRTGPGSVDG